MIKIILTCQRCGQETNPDDATKGLCPECHISDLLKPGRAEILRLVRKRNRYEKTGISLRNLDQQLTALCKRTEEGAIKKAPKLAGYIRPTFQKFLASILYDSMGVIYRAKAV